MRWVVFDYGEVISRPTRALPTMAALLNIPAESFTAGYWAFRDEYDRGCSDQQYWRAVGSYAGIEVTDSQAAALTELDIQGWLEIDSDVLVLLGELHESRVALALLSNAPSTMGTVFTHQPWAQFFQHMVISGHLGIAKPNPEIWRVLTDLLEANPSDCLFLDDKQVNIDAARKAGFDARLWTNASDVRTLIAQFGLVNRSEIPRI